MELIATVEAIQCIYIAFPPISIYFKHSEKPELSHLYKHIARKLASDWIPFCLYLSVDEAAISQAEADHQTVQEKCYKVLCQWHKGQGKERTWQTIVQGLHHVGHSDYAEELRERIIRGGL